MAKKNKRPSLRGKTLKDLATGETWKVVRTKRQRVWLDRVSPGPFPSQMVTTYTAILKRFREVEG